MSDRWRYETSAPAGATADRDTRVEELLLAGLDQYFAGHYDQAINVWTRVLFLDRGHARARAYIERARGAIAEGQRHSEEVLQTGVDAFERGDAEAARQLLTSAVELGAPQDQALPLLGRLDRLDAGRAAETSASRGRSRRPRPARNAVAERSGRSRSAVVLVVLGILVGMALALAALTFRVAGTGVPLLPPFDVGTPGSETGVADLAPLPIASTSEMALSRATTLIERARPTDKTTLLPKQAELLRAALRGLEGVKPGDPLYGRAEELRAQVQRLLLAAVETVPTQTDAADSGKPQ